MALDQRRIERPSRFRGMRASIFAVYVSELWAAILGALFVVGRAVYALGYYRAADKRSIGAAITGVVNIVLVLGGLIGLGRSLL